MESAHGEEQMYSKEDIFKHSGPSGITAPNWKDAKDKRSVMASLVKGVRVLERDRQLKNQGSQAQAPPWWTSFHFELRDQLQDNNTRKPIIYGAIFEFMPPTTQDPPDEAPRFVTALRGTMLKKFRQLRGHHFWTTALQDLQQDYGILINDLHQSPWVQRVLSCAEDRVDFVGVRNYPKVWLAGYSLGAALALLVGKEMTKKGYPLETYLFNPPFVSLSLEWMKSRKLKLITYVTRTVGRGTLAHLKSKIGDSGTNEGEDDPFAAVKDWEPHLFLNSNDLICSGYIGYFKARKVMKKIEILRDLEKRATRDTVIRSLLSGEWDKEQEPIHLLASAKLIINKKRSSVLKAHEIQQWWNPELDLKFKLYQY